MAMTRACFEAGSGFFALIPTIVDFGAFVRMPGGIGKADVCFFAGFDIGILRSVQGGVVPHHRSPTSAIKPAGQDPGTVHRPELTTVPLCVGEKASPFWIILLLVWPNPEHLEPADS